LSERRRVRLGGAGLDVLVFVEGWFVAVVSSLAAAVVVVAVVDDEGEDDVVVPMRKRNVCGIMA
jgi:inorganic pyrophosphatase